MKILSVAVSPCPNDTFIFGSWALGFTPHPAERDNRRCLVV